VFYLIGWYPRHRAESGWLIFSGLLLVAALVRMSPHASAPAQQCSRWGVLFLLAFASVLLYSPSIDIGRLSDDFVLLKAAADWRLWPSEWEHVRPIPLAVWAILNSLNLATPWLLHLLNTVLHGTNSFLCYRMSRELGAPREVGLVASMLFLVFPGSVEPVTWLAGLQDVMMTTFVLGSLIAALRHSSTLATSFLVLGTLSKETAVCTPVLLGLLGLIRPVHRSSMLAMSCWAALFAVARIYVRPTGDFFQLPNRYLVKEFLVRVYGTLTIAWTEDQISQFPLIPVMALIAIATLLATAISRLSGPNRSAGRVLLALGAWPLMAAAPVYRYLYIAPDLQGSRYLYLPSIGWALVLAWIGLERRRLALRVLLALLLVLGIGGTLLQQQRWQAAASYREQVLLQADAAAQDLGCRRPHFRNGPDTFEGVYVFRNGLNEAFSNRHGSLQGGLPDCEFAWIDDNFVRIE